MMEQNKTVWHTNTRILFEITAAIILLTLTVVLIIYSTGIFSNPEIYIVNESGVLPENVCVRMGINKPVIVYESENCDSCLIALARVTEVEKELGQIYEYVDISTDYGKERLLEIGIATRYVPTIIVDCYVHMGIFTKEEYRTAVFNNEKFAGSN